MSNILGLLQMLEIVEQDLIWKKFQKYGICSNGGFFCKYFFILSLAGLLKRMHIWLYILLQSFILEGRMSKVLGNSLWRQVQTVIRENKTHRFWFSVYCPEEAWESKLKLKSCSFRGSASGKNRKPRLQRSLDFILLSFTFKEARDINNKIAKKVCDFCKIENRIIQA